MTKLSISPETLSQVFALPANERYELAQHLLDTIDETSAAQFDEQFIADLRERRDQMLGGEESVADWRAAFSKIEAAYGEDRK